MHVCTLFGQLDTGTSLHCPSRKKNAFRSQVMLSLKPLDIEIMKRLGSRVNLIPVIAKADTLTPSDLQKFKEIVGKNHLISRPFANDRN